MYALFRPYFQSSLILRVSIALVLGVLAGFAIGQPAAEFLAPFGELLLRLLKFLIIPIVLFTLIMGVNQGDAGSMGRLGRKAIMWYILSTALAMVVGITVATLFAPGAGMSLATDATVNVPDKTSVSQVLLGIVPDNLFVAFTELNLLGIIFTAVTFGLALLLLRKTEAHRDSAEQVLKVIDGLNEATMMIMRGVLHYLPIGIFAIVTRTVAEQGTGTIVALAGMVVVLYVALLAHAGLYGVVMVLFKVRIGRFLKHARTPIMTAFATQSSSGTLPVSLNAARDMGLSRQVYGFLLPLGSTINMDGAAIRIAISAVFAANVTGIPLDLVQMAQIVLVGTLATIGTAGIPGAGIVMIATVFTQVGLPIETVALLTSIDALVGMGATALNVTGDLVGASVIDRSEQGDREEPEEAVSLS